MQEGMEKSRLSINISLWEDSQERNRHICLDCLAKDYRALSDIDFQSLTYLLNIEKTQEHFFVRQLLLNNLN